MPPVPGNRREASIDVGEIPATSLHKAAPEVMMTQSRLLGIALVLLQLLRNTGVASLANPIFFHAASLASLQTVSKVTSWSIDSCKSIGCGNTGASCSCEDDCDMQSDCCDDYQETCSSCRALGCGHGGGVDTISKKSHPTQAPKAVAIVNQNAIRSVASAEL